jgi:hypothetical protein
MPEGPDVVDGILKVLKAVSDNTAGTVLSACGLLMLALTFLFVRKLLKSEGDTGPPDADTLRWAKWAIFVCLIFSIAFSAAGPAVSLLPLKASPAPTLSPDQILERLERNSRVYWLVRLIRYNPDHANGLDVGHLAYLGKEDQRYVFVADYAELRGRTVRQALEMVGGRLLPRQRVTGIIFPLDPSMNLIPANARGILQTVSELQTTLTLSTDSYFDIGRQMSPDELSDLRNRDTLSSWSFDSYGKYYPHYCRMALALQCDDKYVAKQYMGTLGADWDPLGFSRKYPATDICHDSAPSQSTLAACESTDWSRLTDSVSSSAGARAFLIKNVPIDTIEHRYMFDFAEPSDDRIPDLGLPPAEGPEQ